MAENTTPTIEAWQHLYALMAQVKKMAPWEWMFESDIFAVRDPESGAFYFISVMGNLGEHLSVAVYQGTRALAQLTAIFNHVQTRSSGEEILEISHLQASFEDRAQLSSKDRQTIKQLGLKFRGRMAWPLFRSYKAGYVPWHLEAGEVRILTLALEQLLEVAPRFAADEVAFPQKTGDYLTRIQGEDGRWQEQIVSIPPAAPESIDIRIPRQSAEAVRRLQRGHNVFEADLFLMPGSVGDRRSRPQFAYIFLVVDAQSGMILNGDTLYVTTTFNDMLAEVPKRFVDICLKMQGVPDEIHVSSERVEWLLSSLSSLIDCKIKRVRHLHSLDNARNAMLQFFIR